MTQGRVMDDRGYTGSERNRVLSPEEVVWARSQYAARAVSAAGLARQWGMSAESVRRMLRGETYSNVGQSLPRETLPEPELPAAAEKVLEAVLEAKAAERVEEPTEAEKALDSFFKSE